MWMQCGKIAPFTKSFIRLAPAPCVLYRNVFFCILIGMTFPVGASVGATHTLVHIREHQHQVSYWQVSILLVYCRSMSIVHELRMSRMYAPACRQIRNTNSNCELGLIRTHTAIGRTLCFAKQNEPILCTITNNFAN